MPPPNHHCLEPETQNTRDKEDGDKGHHSFMYSIVSLTPRHSGWRPTLTIFLFNLEVSVVEVHRGDVGVLGVDNGAHTHGTEWQLTWEKKHGTSPLHTTQNDGDHSSCQKLHRSLSLHAHIKLKGCTIFPFEDLPSAPHLLGGLLRQVSRHHWHIDPCLLKHLPILHHTADSSATWHTQTHTQGW